MTELAKTMMVEDWPVSVWPDGEPRIRDLDLAEKLGYEKPLDVREMIGRRLNDSGFGEVFRTVRKTASVAGGRPGEEYHLTEPQALEIAATSETPNGKTILRALIKVFIMVRRGLLTQELKPLQLAAIPEAFEKQALQLATRGEWAIRAADHLRSIVSYEAPFLSEGAKDGLDLFGAELLRKFGQDWRGWGHRALWLKYRWWAMAAFYWIDDDDVDYELFPSKKELYDRKWRMISSGKTGKIAPPLPSAAPHSNVLSARRYFSD